MKKTEMAMTKSADIAPIPVIMLKMNPLDFWKACLMISMLTGPNGAARENPRTASCTAVRKFTGMCAS